jgi:hypothetical protein
MSRLSTLQEVILLNDTGFANRQFVEQNPQRNPNNYLSKHENLKAACWNGELQNLIPEIFFMFTPDTKLFLWQMRECENMMTLEMSEEPSPLDAYASIDPYVFMEIQEYN